MNIQNNNLKQRVRCLLVQIEFERAGVLSAERFIRALMDSDRKIFSFNYRTCVWNTGRGNNEAFSAPADRNGAPSRCKRSQSRCITPCQVNSTQGSSFIFVVLLRKATNLWRCIFCIDGNETVSIRLNGSDEAIKRGCRWFVGSNLDRRNKLFEESKWSAGNGDGALLSPDY